LLLEPLSLNKVESQNFSIEMFAKQKKRFSFKRRDYEIGGDLNIAHSISLRDKKYTLIVNADAMGKSIQGAGGVLVLGSILRAIIERSRLSLVEQGFTPERWLKNAIGEIQLVFEGFTGSMFVSAVLGLLEEDTGCFFYINAEHPTPILLRNGKARFIDEPVIYRKIGNPVLTDSVRIRIIRLLPNDVVVVGSDGKDDIFIGTDETQKKINEDESLFVNLLTRAHGDIKKTIDLLTQTGEIIDDISLLRITYTPKPIEGSPNLQTLKRAFREKITNLKSRASLEELTNTLREYTVNFPEDTDAFLALGPVLRKKGAYSSAIDCYERVRLREGANLKTFQALVDLHAYTGNIPRATKILEECLQIAPNDEKTKSLQHSLHRRRESATG